MRHALIAMAILTLAAVPAAAEETTATAVVCTGVEEREPVGTGESFPADVGSLTCFSEVRNGEGSVVHAWFHADNEVLSIELPVRGERWRTWSSKRIYPEMTGAWRVEVRTADGVVLATASFTVE